MTPRFATIAPTAADLRGGVLPLGPLRGGPWLSDAETLRIEVPTDGISDDGAARQIDAALSGDGPLFGESAQSPELAAWYQEAGLTAGGSLLIRRIGRGRVRVSPLGPPFRFIDLFAGIGGFRLGFEAAGGECVFSSEIDADACDTYEANFGDRPHGDITAIDAADVPEHDLLLGGFPCQAFSIIGKRRGFEDTRGTLFFDVARILKERRPAAAVLENVKQFRTHDGGRTCATVVNTLEELGYTTHVTVLNALNYGVAQRRERTFIVALRNDLETAPFRWPEPYPERADLAEILEPDDAVAPKLWGTEYIRAKRLARLREQGKQPIRPSIWHENKGGHIGQHPYSCALRANASHSYLLVNGERRPTGRELLRLQGFPDDFRIAVSHRALRKQCGNSVAVPVIAEVAAAVRRALRDA
ncbi:DNA cytosine methyltransferase [Alienimonas californiensis]|uniref:Cytosine-specific methyltransferase n=1 Tax=Alienimonas californiensis TaxID=2527989 RepID=A0A517P6X7_9PLAN|nr:DNA cytosine methyltransferase [Alienimonas californiensis]QDT15137.1 Modification methylase HhaI [Alienimonas californiensis]